MHHLMITSIEIPSLVEDIEKNEEIARQKASLEELLTLDSKNRVMTQLLIERCNNMRDTFSRAVNDATATFLESFSCYTENPDYLEFYDGTAQMKEQYQSTIDCVKLADGRIVPVMEVFSHKRYVIRNGLVYQCSAGPAKQERRTKSAKRMKALPNYPICKVYSNFDEYAHKYWGLQYYSEQDAYGYYYNPDAYFDWYSMGGRWPELFLVKEDCKEYSIGECTLSCDEDSHPHPEGYKWVCAARKKDIEWQVMKDWLSQQTSQYPICFFGYFSEDGCFTQNDFITDNCNRKFDEDAWNNARNDYLDSIPDNAVLVGIDCHV